MNNSINTTCPTMAINYFRVPNSVITKTWLQTAAKITAIFIHVIAGIATIGLSTLGTYLIFKFLDRNAPKREPQVRATMEIDQVQTPSVRASMDIDQVRTSSVRASMVIDRVQLSLVCTSMEIQYPDHKQIEIPIDDPIPQKKTPTLAGQIYSFIKGRLSPNPAAFDPFDSVAPQVKTAPITGWDSIV